MIAVCQSLSLGYYLKMKGLLYLILFFLIPMFSEEESQSEGDVRTVPTLGHQTVMLGGLYSAVEDKFLPGLSLWSEQTIASHKSVVNHPKQEIKWTSGQSESEKYDLLNIELGGSVQVDLKMASISAEGSFKYLQESKDYTQSEVAVLHYRSESKTEALNGDIARKVKGGLDTDIILDGFIRYFPESFSTFTLSEAECSLFKRLPKNYKPTHVVTAVSYGADAHIVFSKMLDIDYDVMDIDGYLEASVDMKIKVPVAISGYFKINYTDDVKNTLDQTRIKMYSDFILDKQPTTVEETLRTFEDISSNIGNKENEYKYSSPMFAHMIPINVYCPEENKMVHAIKKSLNEEIILVRENLLKHLAVIDFLLKTSPAKNREIGSLLRDFKRKLFLYLLDYTKRMIDAIVVARYSDPDGSKVIEVLNEHNGHAYFNDNNVINYIIERRRQVAAMNIFYYKTLYKDTPQISFYAKASIPGAMLTRPLVFVLYIGVLPDLEKDKIENFKMENQINNWYNDDEVVGDISDAWNILRLFFNYNNYKKDSDFFIKFLPTNNSHPQVIKLFRYGKHLTLLLTSDEYKIRLQKDGNKITRNSDCSNGGDEITVSIQNPDKEFVIGVKIVMIPFVQEQELGKDQFFEPIETLKNFDNDKSIPVISTIPVNPEFSYHVSVAFSTKYGHLNPSENVTIHGEFGRMMTKHVGCYIQNDFYFKNSTKDRKIFDAKSSIECATSCFKNENCTEGWSYQQATRKCLYVTETEKIDVLQPNSHVLETDRTVGWATGLKACYEPDDQDGGWSDWERVIDGICSYSQRECNNPPPCGGGLYCRGEPKKDVKGCNPVDGKWGSWGKWSSCSKTCGDGTKTRTRKCDSPAPVDGGQSCPGDSTEKVTCNSQKCPVHGRWGTWASWSSCSNPCGEGTKTRTRKCDSPAPVDGGQSCPGDSTEKETCNSQKCLLSGNIVRNKLLGTIPSWGPFFRINCEIYLNSLGSASESESVLAFRGNNATSNVGKYGDRVPIIELYNGKLYFFSALTPPDPKRDHGSVGVQTGKWYKIIIEQINKRSYILNKWVTTPYFSVSMDGKEIFKSINYKAQAFENVKVFAGDNFLSSANGAYRNLFWENLE